MNYTISEIAKMLNVSTYTIRYYDKEGLFPNVKRVNGIRIFDENDMPWLRILNCLKNTGMPIKKIKEYLDLCKLGDASLKERYELILKQEEKILNEMQLLEENLKEIKFKKAYYEMAILNGSEEAVKNWSSLKPSMEADVIPNKKEDL